MQLNPIVDQILFSRQKIKYWQTKILHKYVNKRSSSIQWREHYFF